MEVHAHTHTARKKWTHYFWEFLMLFLAVFCGFLAEYKLEQTIERHREKEFILSMIEDAEIDTANIHEAIPANQERIDFADSMASICNSFKGTQQEITRLYQAHRRCVFRPDLVYPTDRTLFQLKNSGGMRLIRKKNAAVIINGYDNCGKRLINQQTYYEMYLTAVSQSSAKMMNFLEFWGNKDLQVGFASAKLLSPDKTKMLELENNAILFKGVMMQYVNRLQEMEQEAVKVINTLKKEYDIQ